MLQAFTVDNFKSLVNVDFQPRGLNLLIGANNAGKTSLCQALRFLSLTSSLSLDDAAMQCTAEPWNLLNVYLKNQRLSLTANCVLTLGGDQLNFSYELVLRSNREPRLPPRRPLFAVERESLKVSGGGFSDTTLLENNEGAVRLLHERRFLHLHTQNPDALYVATNAPPDATMLFRLYDLETNQRSNLFKRYLASWNYYNLDPVHLRSAQARSMDVELESTGANLSSVLFSMNSARPRLVRQLIDLLKLLEPRVDLLSFQQPDLEHVYMFLEDRQGNRFGVHNVSDGTLRYLAICYLILAGANRVDEDGGPPIIIVEEPENGIFVGHLRELFDTIDPSGQSGQFIFTSHNPYFIDLFDANLEGLFLVKSGETHSTLLRPDAAKIKDRLGTFSLGEMHFRGLFE